VNLLEIHKTDDENADHGDDEYPESGDQRWRENPPPPRGCRV
jgi:hypothetical protein